VLRREVAGVQIVGDQFRFDREEPPAVRDPVGEGAQGLVVLEIADVV